MTSTQNSKSASAYSLEADLGLEPLESSSPANGRNGAPVDDDVERRVYYIRGKSKGERVVATIRARSRERAIQIAASNGIRVDRREMAND